MGQIRERETGVMMSTAHRTWCVPSAGEEDSIDDCRRGGRCLDGLQCNRVYVNRTYNSSIFGGIARATLRVTEYLP